ncbi:MAG: hypothetical protein QOE72_2837 [Chloroflexota bacterium]|jgi:hypothetical protein|nr:hypothetical protein [Chloroflexota bacterium]
MVDLRRLMPVTLVTLALGVSFSPIVSAQRADQLPGRPVLPALTAGSHGSSAAPATAASQYMPVRTMGSARNESSDPLRQKFTFPLYSMVDGSLVGNATDDLACSQTVPPPCAVFDAITTFRFTQGMFPVGTIVNHAQVSIAPDAQRPGFIINGSRATGTTIQSATGAYAGRTGTIIISGANDAKSFPNQLTQDDFWLIALQ